MPPGQQRLQHRSGDRAGQTETGSTVATPPSVALHLIGVELIAVSASSISIAVLVDSAHEERTLRLLHDTFGLGQVA
jgi:aspartokinase